MRARILFLNRWPRYRSDDRWDNQLSQPEDLIDPGLYQVTYICDPVGKSGVPADAEEVHVLEDFTEDEVLRLVGEIVDEQGTFDHVIAFSEYLLDLAAKIREIHGIPGPRPLEVDRFRDKTVMKTVVASAGIRVPRWIPCRSTEQVLIDAESLGYPLIFKPARGASSEGVRKVASAEQLRALCELPDLADHEIEEFVTGEVMHADGVVDQRGECLFMTISRYVSNCLDFTAGEPLGSVLQTDPDIRSAGRRFALDCLSALELKGSAFHLEFFDTGRELVFLEIGARVPGADVAHIINEVCEVNLYRLWVDVLLGHPVDPPQASFAESGGWLMVPRPTPLPQKVLTSTPLVGSVPFLYRELVPRPGDVLEHAGGYATLQGGRFLFRGGTQTQIADAMHSALAQYRLTAEPVG